MTANQRRIALWAALGGSVLVGLFFAFRPQAVSVDVLDVTRGELVVTIDEEGETRVRDVFVLSSPVAGRMQRVEAEAGDIVRAGETILAEIERVDPTFLDFRGEAQAKAAVNALAISQLLSKKRPQHCRRVVNAILAEQPVVFAEDGVDLLRSDY